MARPPVPITVLTNQLSATSDRARCGRKSALHPVFSPSSSIPHGTVVIGGGWQGRGDPDTGRTELVPENIIGNIRLACTPFRRCARRARALLGRFEAETADALPRRGAALLTPMCGSVHSGYTSGPYIAKLLAERILGREPEMPLFPIERLLAPAANADRPSDYASASS